MSTSNDKQERFQAMGEALSADEAKEFDPKDEAKDLEEQTQRMERAFQRAGQESDQPKDERP